jgi:hypothetical protein
VSDPHEPQGCMRVGLDLIISLYFRCAHSSDSVAFRTDLFNIARTTLSSKVLAQDKEYFANLAVDAVLRLKGSTDLDHIQIIKKVGGKLTDSYLDEGAWVVGLAGRGGSEVLTVMLHGGSQASFLTSRSVSIVPRGSRMPRS